MIRERILTYFASEKAAHVLLPHRSLWRILRRRSAPPRFEDCRRILVIRTDEIGDLVLSSAFFRELRMNAPAAQVTVAVKSGCEPLLEACPYIDAIEVIPTPRGTLGPGYWARARAFALRRNWSRSFRQTFDLVMLPRRSTEFRDGEFYGFASGLGCVVGLEDLAIPATADARYRRTLFDFRFPVRHHVHDRDYALLLIEALGGKVKDRHLEAWTDATDEAAARDFIARTFPPGARFAVVHPSGGASPLKQWPRSRFQEAMRRLSGTHGLRWVVVGGPDEGAFEDGVAQDPEGPISAVGKLGLRTLAALMRHADLFLGGDSGPMHLAAAAGTPVVAVFGPTSESRFAPLGNNCAIATVRAPCNPDQTGTFVDRCQQCIYPAPHCMEAVSVDQVVNTAASMLDRRAAPPSTSAGQT